MRKFDLSKLEERAVVNCTTEEDTRDFLEYLDSVGITWNSGTSTREDISDRFNDYRDETCFNLEKNNKLSYDRVSWYWDRDYEILDLSEIEIFENTQQPTPKNNFKEYGFEGDFEGEIFKKINNELFGIIFKEGNANSLVVIWNSKSGKCYGNEGQEYQEYNLTPLKKPWYTQEENFEKYIGKLIINKFGEVRQILSIDSSKVATSQQNMYHDTLISQEWRLVNEEDTTKLIYKEDK